MMDTQTKDTERKHELLALARRSRMKWVVDGIDPSTILRPDDRMGYSEILSKIPVAECIENVLELFSEVIGDGEIVDARSLISLNSYGYDSDDNILMENEDIPSYEANSTPFAVFIKKLKHIHATEIVKSMQQFVAKFEAKVREAGVDSFESGEEEGQLYLDRTSMIWGFYDHILTVMRECILWSSETETQWEKTKLSCENFIFIKLYELIFATEPEDYMKDERINLRIKSLGFLTAEHLDVKSLTGSDGESFLSVPSKILGDLEKAKSPQDKLHCIRKCSVAIAQVLKQARKDGSLPGADEFLPMMILVVKEANPQFLHSTIKYLQRFTHSSKLVSEAGYLMTHFISAVHFLENVDANALTISPEEFDRSMRQCKEVAQQATEALIAQKYRREMTYHATYATTTSSSSSSTGSKSTRSKLKLTNKLFRQEETARLQLQYFGDADRDDEKEEEQRVDSPGWDSSLRIGYMGVVETSPSESGPINTDGVKTDAAAGQREDSSRPAESSSSSRKRNLLTDNVDYDSILSTLLAAEKERIIEQAPLVSTSGGTASDAAPIPPSVAMRDSWLGRRPHSTQSSSSSSSQQSLILTQLSQYSINHHSIYSGECGSSGNGSSSSAHIVSPVAAQKIAAAAVTYDRRHSSLTLPTPTVRSHNLLTTSPASQEATPSLLSEKMRLAAQLGRFADMSADRVCVGDLPLLLEEYKLLLKACLGMTE